MMISQEEKDLIIKQDQDTKCEWWCILNRWEWPREIPLEETVPDELREDTPRRSSILRFIEGLVSHKNILKYSNKDRMTIEEFEDFWAGHFEGDKEALKRSNQRVRTRITEQNKNLIKKEKQQ